MKKKTARKRPAVNKVYYIYVGIPCNIILYLPYDPVPERRFVQLYGLERIWRLELCWSAQLSAHVLRCRYRKCIPVHFQVCSDRNDPCKCDQSDPCVCTECEDQIQKHDQSFLLSSIYAWKPDRWIYF